MATPRARVRQPSQAAATRHAARAEHHRGLRFFLPWLALATLPLVGNVMHHMWGQSLPVATLTSLGVTAGTALLSVMTYLVSRQARPHNVLLQGHSVATSVLVGVTLLVTQIFGWHRPWADAYILFGVVLVLTWNVRRYDIFRMDDTASHPDGILGELGISVKSRKVVTQDADRAEVKLKLSDGQTVEDIQGVAKRIGSHVGALRNGVTAVPGKREGDVTLSLEFADVLKDDKPWTGPTHPGGSIADGFHPGMYRDGLPVLWYPAGDYTKNISPGHTAIGGTSGSGKGGFARVTICELATRRDVVVIGSDTRKGKQFTGPVAPALAWWETQPNGVKAQFRAVERAVKARNDVLGEADYDSWTPKAYDELGMPAVVYWMEEAAAALDDVYTRAVELSEAARSAGIFLVFSAQRWSADRVPTSLRFNISNTVCYGTGDDVSASFLLTDGTLAAGNNPAEWKTRFPGRALAEFNGVEESRYPVSFKTFWVPREQSLALTTEWGPRMANLDPWTIVAFGEAYVRSSARAQAVANFTAVQMDADIASGKARIVDDEPEQPEPQPDDQGEDDDMDAHAPLTAEELADLGLDPVPTMDDPELDELAAGIDPRAPLPPYEGPEIDMRPEPDGRPPLSPEERREKFTQMLAELMVAGQVELSMSELVGAWYQRIGEVQGNQRAFLHELLNDRIEQGQVERVGRGRYRLVELVEVGDRA